MANCIVTIVGKNGMSGNFELSDISQNSEIEDIVNALSESDLRQIESFIEDKDDKKELILLDSSQSDYSKQVIGNYNLNSIEAKLKTENSSFSGFSPYTQSLLNVAKQTIGDINFILYSNLDYSAKNAISDIKGAVLRYEHENPLLLIKGNDPDAIENTLTHEIMHLLFNKAIELDKGLQDTINKLYREISKRAKNLKAYPEIKEFITVVDTLDTLNSKNYVPTETFAYLFQDVNSYNYILEHFPKEWHKFNELIALKEPTGSIKNDTVIEEKAGPTDEVFNQFKKPEAKIDVTFTKEQQEVIDGVNNFINNGNPDDFYVISGKAGTGKTTVAQAIALAFPNHNIITGAFTHQATSVIGGKFKDANLKNVQAYTLASMLGMRKDEKNNDFKVDAKSAAMAPIKRAQIIIIDEASMIHEEHLEQIMQNKSKNAKVIFLGDVGQLRPVRSEQLRKKVKDSKSPVFDKVGKDNIAKLHTRIRQGEESPILPFADYYWNASQHIKQPAEIEKLNNNRKTKITDKGALIFVNSANSVYSQMLDLFKEGIMTNNPNKIRYITYTNDDRETVNKSVRDYIFGENAPKFVKYELITFTNSLVEGSSVIIPNSTNAQIIEEPRYLIDKLIIKNKPVDIRAIELTIKMGDFIETIRVVDPRDSSRYSLLMEGYRDYMNKENKWRTSEYGRFLDAKNHFAEIDYGYAITSHKSQGSTFDVAVINERNIMEVSAISDEVKAESIYTSLTRPKNIAVVISEKPVDVKDVPDIKVLNNKIENNKIKQPISTVKSNVGLNTNFPLKKIISGGQTGVDQIGLIVAKELGIETGGTAPLNYKNEGTGLTNKELESLGVLPISEELEESYWSNRTGYRNDYVARTEQNVINSDATVYFATSKDSSGKLATEKFAKIHKKPFILNPTEQQLKLFIKNNNVQTLNVAGNRGSKLDNKFADDIKKLLKNVFTAQDDQLSLSDKPSNISFQVLDEAQDFDKMMPHLKWDTENKTFSNINEAYEFFESYKNDDIGLANVWSQPEEVSNISQIANAKSGDILRMSSLDYLPVPKDGEVGLFGPAEWYGKMIPRTELIHRIDQNLSDLDTYRAKLEEDIQNYNNRLKNKKYTIPELTDKLFNSIVNKQIKEKSKYYEYNSKSKTWGDLTENGQKYLNLQPNYILARVFYDKVNNKYKGYIANKFKNSDEASCMLIDLDPSYIQSIRRMDDSFREEYEYKDGDLVKDEDGKPKVKKKSARYDVSKISLDDIETAKAGLISLSNIIDEINAEVEAVKNTPELLEKYTFKNGKSIYKASPHGILISGFFGDLGDVLKEASVGDYVKVLESRNKNKSTNMTWATKVMDLPGGILVMMPSGKYKVVNENNATAVVFAKENLNKYLDNVTEIVDETRQLSRQEKLFNKASENKDFSIYPFWAESDPAKRIDLAKTLKKGDYVKIMFKGNNAKPIEFVAPILFVTHNKIYYGTSKGEISSVDVENFTEGKWIKKGEDWEFTGDVNESFIRAAYVDHRKHKKALNYFTKYLDSANELRELPWTKEEHVYLPLDNLTDQLLGVLYNPQSKLQKTSISSEWAITEFEDSDLNTKVRKITNLVVGDLVKVEYDYKKNDNSTEIRYKWGMVVGKDEKTNEPITAVYGKNGKVIVRKQSYDKIQSVGERSLPIYLNKNTGEYLNYEVEGFEQISKGRPENINRLKTKYSEFFEKGLKSVNVTKDELESMRTTLNRNFGKNWEAVELVYVKSGNENTWVLNYDPEKHTKIETDEVKYRIVGKTFNDKQYSIKQYQVNKDISKLYNAYKASFDQIKSVVTLGDLITYEVTTSNGNKMYVPGIVTEITNSAIQISAIRVETDELSGERLYSNDTYTWFKNNKKQNIKVTEFYGSNYKEVYDLGKQILNENKSLDTRNFKKSFDNRETISIISERLSKLYGVNATLLTHQEMIQKGKELKSNFENVRAYAVASTNEMFINVDKASIAEPLHELSHIIMPGLKSKNPKAYNMIMDKIQDHPSYTDIAENYPELTGRDLDEEVFVTIFAEYFREKMLSEEKNNWLSEEFFELADNIPSVTSLLFDNDIDSDSYDLMNMTLEDIMNDFGSAMITGRLKPLIQIAINLNGNTDVRKIYKSLMDKGKLKKIC